MPPGSVLSMDPDPSQGMMLLWGQIEGWQMPRAELQGASFFSLPVSFCSTNYLPPGNTAWKQVGKPDTDKRKVRPIAFREPPPCSDTFTVLCISEVIRFLAATMTSWHFLLAKWQLTLRA